MISSEDIEAMRDDEWRPIETAPRDGTVIIAYGGDLGYENPTVASVAWDDGWHLDQWETPENSANPTHWMPLPEPPVTK